jgi:dihydroorotate dehydrogenase (NAD+) catalytic subunit
VDTAVRIGSVELPNPIMTASGTAGHGAELAPFMDLSALGAVVVKSLAADPWAGNAAPRLRPTPQGMLNAVGLQGPGIPAWREHGLPELRAAGARVVASVWGHSVDDYARAARMLAGSPGVVALEVNLSCPNLEGRNAIFAHDVELSAAVVRACSAAELPLWAKLSPNTDRLVEVAGAVRDAGAEAVTVVNTLLGMVIDEETGLPALGNGGGGLSGRAIHPVAVRAVHDVHACMADLPIVGVGGVARGWDAIELMLAGASAVQVGTATFVDPRAPVRVLDEVVGWAQRRRIDAVASLTGAAHRPGAGAM